MHHHCKKRRADRHTHRQRDRDIHMYTVQRDRRTDRKEEGGRQADKQIKESGYKEGWRLLCFRHLISEGAKQAV